MEDRLAYYREKYGEDFTVASTAKGGEKKSSDGSDSTAPGVRKTLGRIFGRRRRS
jgi:hypothetical protein